MTSSILASQNIDVLDEGGIFRILQHRDDLSVQTPAAAISAFYMKKQNIHKRQIVAEVTGNCGCVLSAGNMQMTVGSVYVSTNVKGFGDYIEKTIKGKVTGENAVKPLYKGSGIILTEPTYKHLHIVDIGLTNGLIVSDGTFVACEDTVDLTTVMIKTVSGALLGKEGWFNFGLFGRGFAVLESKIPFSELTKITIAKGEQVCIDGPYAVMWEPTITMAVKKSTRSFVGSAISGECLVNVFTGEGSVWIETAVASCNPGF